MARRFYVLFMIMVAGGAAIRALRQSPAAAQASARLRVELRDAATKQLVPGRFYLTDEQGASKAPSGAIVYQKGPEQNFVTGGEFNLELAPGRYTLSAERGPEFFPVSSTLQLSPGEEHKETLSIERWIEMNRHGWFSADLHNHRKPDEIAQLLLAEDLNLAPTLTDWIWEDSQRSSPPVEPNPIKSVDAAHVYSVLDKEVERLGTGPGAVDLLGIKSTIPFQGYRLYPPNDTFCEIAHSQKGYVDAEKIVWRDAAALVALRHIDFAGIVHNHFNRHNVELETERWGMIPKGRAEFDTIAGMPLWSMEVYYRWLNCGFRLPVSAGSASGVKPAPLGYNRVYAKVAGPFGYYPWFDALKAGRSFATNGPMLFFTVNGKEPGETLRFSQGKSARLRVQAEGASAGPLDRLEIVCRGRIVKTVSTPDSKGKLKSDFEYAAGESGWLAARCFEKTGRTIRFAHTSPVFIEVAGSNPRATEDALFFIEWIDREIQFYQNETGFRDPQHREAMLAFFRRARDVYAKLK